VLNGNDGVGYCGLEKFTGEDLSYRKNGHHRQDDDDGQVFQGMDFLPDRCENPAEQEFIDDLILPLGG
jgi:hypothetical protein